MTMLELILQAGTASGPTAVGNGTATRRGGEGEKIGVDRVVGVNARS
jgi:hypothetical protein